jgi:hypothetical protein
MSCHWNATRKICKLKVDLNNAYIDMLNLIISLLGHVTQVYIKRKIKRTWWDHNKCIWSGCGILYHKVMW